MIRKIYLIVNQQKDQDGEKRKEIRRLLEEKGIAYIESPSNGKLHDSSVDVQAAAECDAIFTVGGDGTLISAARQLRSLDIPFFPINIGTLGYLTETGIDRAGEAIDRIIRGDYVIQDRMRLLGILPDGGEMTALNDIVITRTGTIHILDFELYINGKIIHRYRADGMILSTSTGSTGYNMSAGGAILEPEAQMMVLTPICPHTIRATSLVVSGDDELMIKVASEDAGREESGLFVAASFDGGDMYTLKYGDSITVRKARRKTSLIRFEDDSFLDALYNKMKDN